MTKLLDDFVVTEEGELNEKGQQAARNAYAKARPAIPFSRLTENQQSIVYCTYVAGLQDGVQHVMEAMKAMKK